MARIIFKDESVIFNSMHLVGPVIRILEVAAEEWPWGIDIIITRGSEWVKGSAPESKHMDNCAFDIRARNLPPEIDREKLIRRILSRLGSDYYGYYGRYVQAGIVVEWFHLQYDGGKKL